MQKTIHETAVKIASLNGIDIFMLNSDKFKTNTISIFFQDDLSNQTASLNALFPAVLRRGCEAYPTMGDISRHLEELYGAAFDCGVNKKGEYQIINFFIEYVADKYIEENGSSLFEKAFRLLNYIITNPALENDCFINQYVEQEKENLIKLIESRVNDKVQYTYDRCIEEMCKNEPFGIHEYGNIDDIKKISSKELFEHYKKALCSLPMSIYISGAFEEKNITLMKNILSDMKRNNIKQLKPLSKNEPSYKDKNEIVQKMNVNQGKLSLGFRTGIFPGDDKYYTLMVYNSILGSGMHSKLFQNVREKMGLVYYAGSSIERYTGLMLINAGIEISNKERVEELILHEMQEMVNGNISDYEYFSALKAIETGIKTLKDTQLRLIDFYFGQKVSDTHDTLDSIIQNVKKVTKDNIVNVAKKIRLDTVYFLRN